MRLFLIESRMLVFLLICWLTPIPLWLFCYPEFLYKVFENIWLFIAAALALFSVTKWLYKREVIFAQQSRFKRFYVYVGCAAHGVTFTLILFLTYGAIDNVANRKYTRLSGELGFSVYHGAPSSKGGVVYYFSNTEYAFSTTDEYPPYKVNFNWLDGDGCTLSCRGYLFYKEFYFGMIKGVYLCRQETAVNCVSTGEKTISALLKNKVDD